MWGNQRFGSKDIRRLLEVGEMVSAGRKREDGLGTRFKERAGFLSSPVGGTTGEAGVSSIGARTDAEAKFDCVQIAPETAL